MNPHELEEKETKRKVNEIQRKEVTKQRYAKKMKELLKKEGRSVFFSMITHMNLER